MGRLTSEERRRIFLTKQQARGEMFRRLRTVPTGAELRAPRSGPRRVLTTAIIVTLVGGGWLAYHTVEFHPPASVVEALLPRL